MSALLPDLNIGTISAILNDSGKTPPCMHKLNILVIIGAIIFTLSLIKLIFGVPDQVLFL